MRIIELQAENVKRLKAVTIKPAGPVVQITGKNGSGKTSVLDSIWWALGGKEDIQAVPLRKGAEKGSIRLDLGDLIVERKFNASGTTTLTVANKADGSLHRSPQAMLDSLIGRLSFDPLSFAHKKPRDQYEEIKAIAKVDVDLEALEAANKADFEKRTSINRRAKEIRSQAAGVQAPNEAMDRVNVAKLAADMEEASRFNAALEIEKRKRADAESLAAKMKAEADGLAADLPKILAGLEADFEAELKIVREKFAGRVASAKQAVAKAVKEADARAFALQAMAPCGEPMDLALIRSQIEQAENINRSCDLFDRRERLIAEAKELEAESAALTAAMEKREAEKVTALQSAQMPVAGLSLGNGIVMLDGLPLEQASDAQQLRLSVAVAMSANPKLRVIRIRDGSLLDEDGMALLAEMAKDREYQVWIEKVDSTGSVGVVMVDGEVAADHQTEVPA